MEEEVMNLSDLLYNEGMSREDAEFFNKNFEPGEISKERLIYLLARSWLCQYSTPQPLELRTPFIIKNREGKIVGLGLAKDRDEVINCLCEQGKTYDLSHSILATTREKYNEYLRSIDFPTFHLFGV
jgi:hypothetical protein